MESAMIMIIIGIVLSVLNLVERSVRNHKKLKFLKSKLTSSKEILESISMKSSISSQDEHFVFSLLGDIEEIMRDVQTDFEDITFKHPK